MLSSDDLRTGLTRGWPWHDWALPADGLYADLVWTGAEAKPTEAEIETLLTASEARIAAEIADAPKEAAMEGLDRLALKVMFNHENRIRALEGKSAITAAQFRAALKAML